MQLLKDVLAPSHNGKALLGAFLEQLVTPSATVFRVQKSEGVESDETKLEGTGGRGGVDSHIGWLPYKVGGIIRPVAQAPRVSEWGGKVRAGEVGP
jgi:hypothetical protein